MKTKAEKIADKIDALKERLKKTVIRVTRRHITKGAPGSTDECAVALAFGDAFRGRVHCIDQGFTPSNGTLRATFTGINDDVSVKCIIPSRVCKFAKRFDQVEGDTEKETLKNKKKLKPLTFRIAELEDVHSL